MAQITLLIIGDPKQFSFITTLFSECGAKTNILTAQTSQECLQKLQSTPADVIIASFILDNQNGIDFVNRLKKQAQSNPITIFVGEQEERTVKDALKAGIDCYYSLNGDQELESARIRQFIRLIIKIKQTDEALAYADTNFRTIIEATEDSIYMIDRHYRYLYINTPHLRRLGIEGQDYESKMYRDIHTEEDSRRFIAAFNQVVANKNLYIEEYEKEDRYYYRKFIPVKYPSSPQILAVTVVSTDVTDRVRLENEVERSASLVSATMETTSDGLFVVDRAGKIISYNQKFLDMWFIPETVIEERDEEVLMAYIEDQLENREEFIQKLNSIKSTPEKESFDVLEFRDGRVFERLTLPQRIGGTIIGRVWSFRDVTSQRKTISSLHLTQANYRSVVESTGDSVFMVDRECCYIFMNSYHKQKIGDLADKYLEQRMRVMLPPGEEKRFEEGVKRIFLTKKSFNDEFNWNGKDYIRRFTPVLDPETDEVRSVTVVLTDITEHKAAETEVKNSEERLKILFDYAPEAYFLTDIKGTFIDSNKAATSLSGFLKEDLKGKNIFTMGLIGSMHITKTAVLFAKNALGKPTGPDEVVISRKDGKEVYAEVMTYPIRIRDKSLVMTIARDITDRRLAEEALRQREEQYRLLVTNANEGIFVLQEYSILFVNTKGASVLNQRDEDCIGMNLLSLVHPDDQERFSSLILQAAAGGEIHAGSEIRLLTPSGDIRWLEIALVYVSWHGTPAVLVMGNDVTERKQAQDALVQTNKKLNLLSSITRHDVLNQITIVLAYLDLLKKKNTDTELLPFIEKQVDATQTIRNQIVFTKEYQDIGVVAPQWQIPGEKIRIARDIKKGTMVSWSEELNKVEIYADPLLEKVFSNLISNSLMHGGTLTKITFSLREEADQVILLYEDDGVGIPDKEKKKIFGHGYGKNTGFGLFLSREILAITGLTISETGTEGKGVRFEINIPLHAFRRI